MSKVISARVNDKLAVWLERQATKLGVPPGQLLREQLEQAHAQNLVFKVAGTAEKATAPKAAALKKPATPVTASRNGKGKVAKRK